MPTPTLLDSLDVLLPLLESFGINLETVTAEQVSRLPPDLKQQLIPLLPQIADRLEQQAHQQLKSTLEHSFESFAKHFWSAVPGAGAMKWNWHMSILCQEMQANAERVFNSLPRERDLIFNVSPGTSKSTLGSILFQAWTWTRFPQARHICASHTEQLVLDLAAKCRYVIMSEEYQKFWPLQFRSDQSTKSYFANTLGGDRLSCTVGGKSPLGFHGHFLTCLPGDSLISVPSALFAAVPIQLLAEGANVLGYSHVRGRRSPQTVLAVQRTPGRPLLRLHLKKIEK
jgi:hypothetical protein